MSRASQATRGLDGGFDDLGVDALAGLMAEEVEDHALAEAVLERHLVDAFGRLALARREVVPRASMCVPAWVESVTISFAHPCPSGRSSGSQPKIRVMIGSDCWWSS